MAREQLNYTATAWKDLEAGGTAITAARLNNIETGIADAGTAINAVNATVLTYLVASDGDTATTDINGAAITGPCFVHDLGTGDTYLDKGQDGQGRVQVGVSKAAFAALQESVTKDLGNGLVLQACIPIVTLRFAPETSIAFTSEWYSKTYKGIVPSQFRPKQDVEGAAQVDNNTAAFYFAATASGDVSIGSRGSTPNTSAQWVHGCLTWMV